MLLKASTAENSYLEEIKIEDMDGDVQRDQSFVANLNYLLENGSFQEQLQEVFGQDIENPTPKGFVAFDRGDNRFFIKKASLVWMLSIGTKRISTDRIYRFISDKKQPDGSNLLLGDFIFVNIDNVNKLAQIISFRFCSGKKFFGDQYSIQKHSVDTNEVEMLLNFFKIQNNLVHWDGRAQLWVDSKKFKSHALLRRDLVTGNIVLLNANK